MAYFEVGNGVKIHASDFGSGKPVVLIHGWPLNRKMWDYQMVDLVDQGYRFISIDIRGFGHSDHPAGNDYNYDTYADDVRGVLDQLDLNGATLVGFSMGGAIALHYTARHNAAHISKLVLAGAAAPKFVKGDGWNYGADRKGIEGLIAGLKADRPAATAAFGSNFFGSNVSKELADWAQSLGMEASAYGQIRAAESFLTLDVRDDLDKITIPTLILHGVKDKIVPFELGEQTHKGIKGSKFVRFENSGHGLFYDEREKFNKELVEFIG